MTAEVVDGVAGVTLGDTLIFLWQAPASVSRHQRTITMLENVAAKSDGGALLLYLLLPSSSPPDAKQRAAMQQDFTRLGSKLRKVIAVPLGNSVWNGVVRTIVRGILLFSGAANRQEVADSPADAIARVRALATSTTPSAAEPNEAIQALFTALHLEAPAMQSELGA